MIFGFKAGERGELRTKGYIVYGDIWREQYRDIKFWILPKPNA